MCVLGSGGAFIDSGDFMPVVWPAKRKNEVEGKSFSETIMEVFNPQQRKQ